MGRGLVFVKLGGSIITDPDKPRTAKLLTIRRLIAEIDAAREGRSVIIGHGGGSFPHVPAHKYKIQLGLLNKKSLMGTSITQRYASELHGIIIDEMLKMKIPVFSFSPSCATISRRGSIKDWSLKPVSKALSNDFVPVTYGDVGLDSGQGVCILSTEEIFRHFAKTLKPSNIIIGTDVDGVFDADPKENPDARLITKITKQNINSINAGVGGRKYNVTGGMKSKVRLLYEISKLSGAKCQIVNIRVPGRLKDAMLGKKVVSTVIMA